uniref:ATP synthase subunit a n=1 Tax=Tityus serrulatus TaxID=6887 RepID=A0A0K1LW79_TITSE|nr:ATP synthase F0 subunit 6 [Tityus serrulatus]AKU46806.1 ATP synthase subunit 6 [Tityus serrulatus]
MSGLFVVFDPSTLLKFHFNWISMMLGLVFILGLFWMLPSRNFMMMNFLFNGLFKEIKSLYVSGFSGSENILCALFLFIVMSNLLGLFPFIFTATSHLLVTLLLALSFWFSLMLFGWLKKTVSMLAHLVPLGTPGILMMFMVLIETISNLIRPITLSVRLAANMIAGHLLIVLLGSAINFNIFLLLSGLSLILLLLLELSVAVIQSYVFMVLVGLYSSEI